MAGGEREPPAGGQVGPARAAQLSDDGAERAAAQCLFHCPEHVTFMRHGNACELFGTEPEKIEAGPVESAI
ncbi:MAG TPA: hypothetical protein VFK15_07490, partial [Burkholderiales bacterium]|nr:hypothetical protein [Burkholderiales bacterium]